MSPRLTLNLGLRWDYESGVVDAENRLVRGFAFDQAEPPGRPGPQRRRARLNARPVRICRAACCSPAWTACRAALFDPDRNNIQPRAGLAYSLNDKTVVRGGYGLYYSFRSQLGSQTGFFVTTPYIAGDINGRVGVPELGLNTFSNPFPNGPLQPPGASLGLLTQVGRGISFDDPTFELPHIHQYNVTVSREITRQSDGRSQLRREPDTRSCNLDARQQRQEHQRHQRRGYGEGRGVPAGTSAEPVRRTAARHVAQRRHDPAAGVAAALFRSLATLPGTPSAIGKTWYNGLQLIVQKRVSRGLTFTSSYTFSRTMEQNEFLNAQDAVPRATIADQDRPHIWQFNGVYELPFGRGQPVGRDTRERA